MSDIARIRDDLTEVSTVVDTAQTLLAKNELVDLGMLEARVEGLCDAIQSLPQSDRLELKPRLLNLIDSLTRLSSSLTETHRELSDQLQSTSNRQRAVSAYHGGSGGFNPRK